MTKWKEALLVVALGLAAIGGVWGQGDGAVERIAFGSCLHQDRPAPIWEAVVEADPDVWVWLGDNIYADTDDGERLAAAYGKVKGQPGYVALRGNCEVVGTWDDHDFGQNNGGKEWRGKKVAQAALLDFLDEPTESPRRAQEGVYWSCEYGSPGRKVKLLLIDVRYHRDDPRAEGADIFGAAQRAWIARELADNDADLTVIASGTQVIPEDHRYEKWAQFPSARQWFFDQLVEHGTGATLFLSGDRHIAEFSKLELEGREQPVYEVTSSSMTHSWEDFPGEPNRHRVGEVFHENNFGLLEIDWERREVRVTVRNVEGEVVRELAFGL